LLFKVRSHIDFSELAAHQLFSCTIIILHRQVLLVRIFQI